MRYRLMTQLGVSMGEMTKLECQSRLGAVLFLHMDDGSIAVHGDGLIGYLEPLEADQCCTSDG